MSLKYAGHFFVPYKGYMKVSTKRNRDQCKINQSGICVLSGFAENKMFDHAAGDYPV